MNKDASTLDRLHPEAWCPPGLHDSEWVLPSDEVAPYLCAIREHLQFGLEDGEIDRMAEAVRGLKVGERTEYVASVVHDGRGLTIKFNFCLIEADTVVLGLCADPALSEELEWSIENVYDELV